MKTLPSFIKWAMVISLLPCTMPAVAADYYLYSPIPAESHRIPANPADGVLVKSIIIKRGDTLTGLSRKYSAKGSYYPQILLFNRIKNPDRIYAGNRLLVPLGRKTKGVTVEQPAPSRETDDAVKQVIISGTAKPDITKQSGEETELQLFTASVKLYEQGEYEHALAKLNKLLAQFPNSSHAADAMLYRAECYANLSGQTQ